MRYKVTLSTPWHQDNLSPVAEFEMLYVVLSLVNECLDAKRAEVKPAAIAEKFTRYRIIVGQLFEFVRAAKQAERQDIDAATVALTAAMRLLYVFEYEMTAREFWQVLSRRQIQADVIQARGFLMQARPSFDRIMQSLASGVDKISASYTPGDLARKIGCDTDTVNLYAKRAGVITPPRGKKNYRYSASDCEKILRQFIMKSTDGILKARCRAMLDNPTRNPS